MTTEQKIRVKLIEKRLKIKDIAAALGRTPNGFSLRLSQNDFKESELRAIAEVLGCELVLEFRDKEDEKPIAVAPANESRRLRAAQIPSPARESRAAKKRRAQKIIMKYSKRYGGPLSDKECIRLAGVTANTFYKYKRELLEAPDFFADPNQISFFDV